MILKLIFIILIILFGKNSYDMLSFSKESNIIRKDKLDIFTNKKILNPIISTIETDFDLHEYLNSNLLNYYPTNNKLIRLSDFYMFDNIYISNSVKLFNDSMINTHIIDSCFFNNFSYNITHEMSIFKDNIYTNLIKNKNNIKIILLIHGVININLYNPIHEKNINSNNKNKYNQKIKLEKTDNFLFIPSNWQYDISSSDISAFITITSDTIFTYHYNLLR